jgi:hypothetical protein
MIQMYKDKDESGMHGETWYYLAWRVSGRTFRRKRRKRLRQA